MIHCGVVYKLKLVFYHIYLCPGIGLSFKIKYKEQGNTGFPIFWNDAKKATSSTEILYKEKESMYNNYLSILWS